MRHAAIWITVGLLAASTTAAAQGWGRGGGRGRGAGCVCPGAGVKAPIASNPAVEMKGKIAKVQIAAGQGTPVLEVEEGGKTTQVQLGSMRYLMQQNFNPKAGDEVVVKGYRNGAYIVASAVKLGGGTELQLRDDAGWPVWGGRGRGRMGRCGNCPNQ